MLEFLTTGLVGALTGFFGSIITSITNYKLQKLKNEHDVAMAHADREMLKMEAEASIKITKAQVEGEIEIGELDVLKDSYKSMNNDLFDRSYMKYLMDSKWLSWVGALIAILFGFVDVLKHLARPLLTYYLVGATTWLTILCWKVLEATGEEPLAFVQAFDLFELVVMTIIYLTVSCVSWWFADRRVAKFLARLNDGNSKT